MMFRTQGAGRRGAGGAEALGSSRPRSSRGWESSSFGRGGAVRIQQDDHPRGFLRAGS